MTDMSATAAHGEAGPADDEVGAEPVDPPVDPLAGPHAEARRRAEEGDLTGARTMLEEALAAGELRLGRHDPRLAPLMVDLATIARNLGNLTEAQAQLRRAYGIVVATSGPDDATALSIEGRLAAVTYRLGEPTEPYDWHLTNVGGRVLGPDHPAIRGALQRLSRAQVMPPPPPAEQLYDGYEPEEPTERDPPEPGFAPHYVPPGSAAAYEPAPSAAYVPSDSPGVYDRREPSDPADIYVVGPPPRTYQPVEVYDEPPLPRPRSSRRRGHGGGVALVVSLGLTIFVAAVVIAMQLFSPAEPEGGAVAGPTAETTTGTTTAPPTSEPPAAPTGVVLRDEGGSVTLTWVDPSGGRVPFIVAGGRTDTTAAPLETVPVGRTTSTIYGLNVRYDYCFTVAAVWSADVIAPSVQTCTNRLRTPSAR